MNKKNFSVKIFIGFTCILLAVGLLVFGILRFFLPKVYQHELESRVQIDTVDLVKELSPLPRTVWYDTIEKFCSSNNINATVFNEHGENPTAVGIPLTGISGYEMKNRSYDPASAVKVYFVKREGLPRIIAFYYNPELIEQINDTFDIIFPVLFVVIFSISLFIAFFYTRFVMSIKNLQLINEKLQADIEDERRRRNFFSAISHELKTPVTILKGELDGMILGVGKFKDRDKYLGEAYKTTQSIESLVKEIMTAAKLDTVKITPEEINLSELTHDCLIRIDELSKEKNIIIKQNISDTPVLADKKLMGIVISNIIGNAVKHSPQNTQVDIIFDETYRFSVENHGTHIGENSSDTDLSGGLGLYIVKSILDMHGLKYSFENTESGTVFSINFTKM
jgi:two-component system sensor histidine kinase VanS